MSLPDRPALDRTAVERVLARAAQLQSSDTGELPAERMTEAQLVELGREVGLSPEHLRQAIAEERTRVPMAEQRSGAMEALVGPALVSATRSIRLAGRTALAQLDTWMLREECLTVMRRFDDRIVWEPRRDFMSQVRRGIDLGGRGFILSRAHTVAGTVVPIDDARSMVRIDADFAGFRRANAGTSAMVATLGAGASGTAVAIGVMLPVAIVPAIALGVGAVYGARRRQRAIVERAQLVLEQILDRLERGELGRPSLFEGLVARRQ